jgi:nucleoside-diphosphate-sugar epimerase
MEGVDYVLHQAAMPSVPRSVQDPVASNAVNIDGTLNLLYEAREARVKRFVFASSSSLYGESATLPKVETMRTAPISPYGLQKATAEAYCGLFHRLYDLPTVALRYFNVFGPRQDPNSDYAAVIPKFITSIKGDRPPVIFGDGEQTRDFTFVANVVQANRRACAAGDEALGLAYNIGCGKRISLNDLVQSLGRLTGRKVSAEHTDPRAGDILHSLASIDHAADKLGFRPEVELDEGLKRTLEAY